MNKNLSLLIVAALVAGCAAPTQPRPQPTARDVQTIDEWIARDNPSIEEIQRRDPATLR